MSKQITIHQHYVPKMYLKHFGIRVKSKRPLYSCYVYNKETQKVEKTLTDNICFQDYLYEYPAWKLRTDINNIENWLNKCEERQSRFIDRFLSNPKQYLYGHLFENRHRGALIALFITLFLRNPDTLKQAAETARQIGVNVPPNHDNRLGLDILSQTLPDFWQDIYRVYNVIIMHNSTTIPFLTSDRPIERVLPPHKPQLPGMYTYCLALSPEWALLLLPKIEFFTTTTPWLFDEYDNIVECEEAFVIQHNLTQMDLCPQYVIAPTEECLRRGLSVSQNHEAVQQYINKTREIYNV